MTERLEVPSSPSPEPYFQEHIRFRVTDTCCLTFPKHSTQRNKPESYGDMKRLVPLIRLLIDHPQWSNAAISQECRCDRRRVRRYRNLLALAGVKAAELEGCDASTLNAFFNPRDKAPRRRQAPPDYERLKRQHPGASGQTLWRAYVVEKQQSKLPHLSYAQFIRRQKDTRP